MKKYLILFLIFYIGIITAQEKNSQHTDTIKWVSMNEALKLQKEKPKKIMIDFYTKWCGPCQMMYKETFHNEAVVSYVNDNYYAVKFNAEGNDSVYFRENLFENKAYKEGQMRNMQHPFATYLSVRAYPTVVIFDENATPIVPLQGYQEAKDMRLYLQLFNSEDYKTIKTYEALQEWMSAHSSQK